MKKTIKYYSWKSTLVGLLILLGSFLPNTSFSQYAAIQNTNIQIYGVLNDNQIAWAGNQYYVELNKQTGELVIAIAVDNLVNSTTTEDFKPDPEKNAGKTLTFTAKIPITAVTGKQMTSIDLSIPMIANFNEINEETFFSFTILMLANRGFSVMAKGYLPQSLLEAENLEEFESELLINFSFTGY